MDNDKLAQDLERLARAMEKSNSFWHSVLVGIGRGLGILIGATLVGAVVVTLAWRAMRTVHLDRFLGGADGPSAGIFQLLKQLPLGEGLDPSTLDPSILEKFQSEATQGQSPIKKKP
ncbi:hypothetical protein HYW17_00195 [Candidatus Uhrbacteria bacterium]|nr:hypothetical protein [Candidatus Uhrbacteria bacterium]